MPRHPTKDPLATLGNGVMRRRPIVPDLDDEPTPQPTDGTASPAPAASGADDDATDLQASGPSGVPLRARTRAKADPAAAAPLLAAEVLHRLTGPGYIRTSGTADRRPPVMRPGAQQSQQHPSRAGNRLYWPDGRVTGLGGEPVAEMASTQR